MSERFFKSAPWSEKGFTVIEIIAVLVIMGIFAVVFASRVSRPVYDLRVQAETLKTHLRFCQVKALSDIDGQTVTSWGMSFTSNSYTLRRNGANAPIKLPNENSPTHSLGSNVAFSTVPGEITFNEWGSPGGADISITLMQGGQTQTVAISRNTGYIP
jgi:prepilin-type N-terminal cleavage/methylation domain-containing protein